MVVVVVVVVVAATSGLETKTKTDTKILVSKLVLPRNVNVRDNSAQMHGVDAMRVGWSRGCRQDGCARGLRHHGGADLHHPRDRPHGDRLPMAAPCSTTTRSASSPMMKALLSRRHGESSDTKLPCLPHHCTGYRSSASHCMLLLRKAVVANPIGDRDEYD